MTKFKEMLDKVIVEASEGAMKMAKNVAKKKKGGMSDKEIEKLANKFDKNMK